MKFDLIKEYVTEFEKENTISNCKEKYFQLIKLLQNDGRKTVYRLSERLKKRIESYDKEVIRVKNMYEFDKKFGAYEYIAGVDEVGRGPLAGPIVSAAVILDLNYKDNKDLILYINDSKKISNKLREELSEEIKKRAIAYKIIEIDNTEIDIKGIGWCNHEVFRRACHGLSKKPDLVLSDGYLIKDFDMKNESVIKGDTKSASIACASILAKVYRDKLMEEYGEKYTQYKFEKNVGYGTEEHVLAIKEFGATDIHRKSFLKNIL
ncbi:MAG: ribonuclease HII [Clostridium sp.]